MPPKDKRTTRWRSLKRGCSSKQLEQLTHFTSRDVFTPAEARPIKQKLQIPPLRYPGFPVEVGGVGKHHAPFLRRKAHTRSCPVLRGRKSGYAPVPRHAGTGGMTKRGVATTFRFVYGGVGRFSKGVRWATPFVFLPRIRISCTGLHRHPRVRLSLRKAA